MALSEPVAGNHNDLYDIVVQFEVVTATLEKANIPVAGLFINADAGFDPKGFRAKLDGMDSNANTCFNKRSGQKDRDEYFDQGLYVERYAVERIKTWMDNYRSPLNRPDTTTEN